MALESCKFQGGSGVTGRVHQLLLVSTSLQMALTTAHLSFALHTLLAVAVVIFLFQVMLWKAHGLVGLSCLNTISWGFCPSCSILDGMCEEVSECCGQGCIIAARSKGLDAYWVLYLECPREVFT